MTVPTDTANNGTTRGPHTLVITVVNESSPFYLTATAQSPIQVMGVSRLENFVPLNAVVINRGNTSTCLLSSSRHRTCLLRFRTMRSVCRFHETWLTPQNTDQEGFANFSYTIPYDHPLGPHRRTDGVQRLGRPAVYQRKSDQHHGPFAHVLGSLTTLLRTQSQVRRSTSAVASYLTTARDWFSETIPPCRTPTFCLPSTASQAGFSATGGTVGVPMAIGTPPFNSARPSQQERIHGSHLHPECQLLRRFRQQHLV